MPVAALMRLTIPATDALVMLGSLGTQRTIATQPLSPSLPACLSRLIGPHGPLPIATKVVRPITPPNIPAPKMDTVTAVTVASRFSARLTHDSGYIPRKSLVTAAPARLARLRLGPATKPLLIGPRRPPF